MDGWTDWHGGEWHLDGNLNVEVRLRSGSENSWPARMYRWQHYGASDDIVAFRITDPSHAPVEFVGPPAPEPTLLEQRLKIFADRGITPIPDDECTDMGDYVVWNKYDPACSLDLRKPEDVEYHFERIEVMSTWGRDDRTIARWHAHPLKPVRLVGWYMLEPTEGGYVRRLRHYSVDRASSAMRQRVFEMQISGPDVYSNNFATASQFDPLSGYAIRSASPAEIPAGHRNDFIEYRVGRLHVEGVANTAWRDNMTASRGVRIGSNPRSVNRFGVITYGPQYQRLRLGFRRMGELIRDAEVHDSDDFIRLADDVGACGGQQHLVDNMIEAWNERSYCEEVERASCGHLVREGDTHDTYDGAVCESCYDDYYVYVEDTEDYRHVDNVFMRSNDSYYTYEERDDDDDEDEGSCGGLIRDYSFNVLRRLTADQSVKSSPYGDFLMGIELEVVPKRGYRYETATHTADNLCSDYAIMKNDGSLASGGFEIVTAPRSLKEHITRFTDWQPHEKLRSWDPGCCGMHVHMSSQAFTPATLGKFIEFINAEENTDFIRSIAGRHARKDSGNAQSYCQVEDEEIVANPKKVLKNKTSSRYHMINTSNVSAEEASRLGLGHWDDDNPINTVELRIFRGTLKKSRLLAQIEFAHAAVMFCRWSSIRELRQEHFIAWLKKAAGMYPNLAKWFGVRANTSVVVAHPPVQQEAEV